MRRTLLWLLLLASAVKLKCFWFWRFRWRTKKFYHRRVQRQRSSALEFQNLTFLSDLLNMRMGKSTTHLGAESRLKIKLEYFSNCFPSDMNDVKNPSSENDTDVELIGIFAKKWKKVKIFERRFKLELWHRIWIFNFKLFQNWKRNLEIILKEPNRIMQDNRMLDR